jgi:hypothetical protein
MKSGSNSCFRETLNAVMIRQMYTAASQKGTPMTDEERQRAMDFIVTQQAKNSVEIEKLIESQRKTELRMEHDELRMERDELRLDRDERILKLMIKAGGRARQHMRDQDARWERRHAELLESQAHTDRRLDALIDIVRADRNGPS